MGLKIIPLHLGSMVVDKSILTTGKNAGIKITIPVVAWLIVGGKEPILVDTGASDPEWSWKYHNPMLQTSAQKIDQALSVLGFRVEDIKTVVNTHLHWDHCFNNSLFKNAEIIVQRHEWEYARNPLPKDRGYYEANLETQPFLIGKEHLRIIDGPLKIMEGIELVPIPGHTPGIQGVAVDTDQGVYFIASDAINLWENWDDDLLSVGQIYYDLGKVYESLYNIRSIAKFVLPGHDPKVVLQKSYP